MVGSDFERRKDYGGFDVASFGARSASHIRNALRAGGDSVSKRSIIITPVPPCLAMVAGEDGVDHDLFAARQQRVGQAVAGDFHVGLDARRGAPVATAWAAIVALIYPIASATICAGRASGTKQLGKRNEGVDLVVQHRGAHCEGVGAIYLVGDVLQRLTAFLMASRSARNLAAASVAALMAPSKSCGPSMPEKARSGGLGFGAARRASD